MSDKAHPGHGKRILAAIAAANAQRNKSLFAGRSITKSIMPSWSAGPIAAHSRTPFTYASLDAEQQKVAKDAAQFIDSRQRGMASAVLEIGQKLNEVKAALGHGLFAAWVDASFNMTMRTAQNYMQAALSSGAKAKQFRICRCPPSTRLPRLQNLSGRRSSKEWRRQRRPYRWRR